MARALVIAPAFFGYEKDIVSEFERQGYDTTFIDERPSNSAAIRAMLRARRGLVVGRIDKYYRAKLSELRAIRFDIALVIKAEVVPRWFLQELRRINPGARFVYYAYDAVDNVKHCLEVLDLFDQKFSFDRDDVENRPELSYLPLFYTSDFSPLPQLVSKARQYTLSFVGTLHTERYAYAKKIFGNRPKTFGFFYVQARWYFAFVKYLTKEHRSVPWSDVSFNKLTRSEVADIFRNSVAVLDMPRSGQSGLTIRTFEVLASGSVLITTNPAIVREPFFDPDRVIVVPGDWESLGRDDLLGRLDHIRPLSGPPEKFSLYSLESWVRSITARPLTQQHHR